MRRDIWQRIQPADPAGLLSVGRFYVTPTGNLRKLHHCCIAPFISTTKRVLYVVSIRH
jgi:hypothetical protein